MSGFEIAGLILGIFPVLVKSLEAAVASVRQIQELQEWRVRLEGLRRDLSTQKTMYVNTLVLLLQEVIDPNDLSELLESGDPFLWQRPEYERRLRDTLGRSYETFLHLTEALQERLRALEQRPLFKDEVVQSLRKWRVRSRSLWPSLFLSLFGFYRTSIRSGLNAYMKNRFHASGKSIVNFEI